MLVMLVISVTLLGITATMNRASQSLSVNENLQQTAQYAQECAEKVLAIRRDAGYTSSSINADMCNSSNLPAMAAGYSRTVSVQDVSGTGTGTDPCPSGTSNCKNVTITVTNGALSSSISVLLVYY